MTKWIAVMVVVGCVVGSVVAVSAQDGLPVPEVGQDVEETHVAAQTEYNFEPDVVTGELKDPGGVVVVGEPGEKLSSLIEVRADFVDRLIVSGEEL